MEGKPEAHIPYATGGIVNGSLGTIYCACCSVGHLIPPKQDDMADMYDERESNP